MLEALCRAIENDRQTVIDLQRLLVSTPALGPESGGDGERVKADRLMALLTQYGLPPFKEYRAPDPRVSAGHRPNLSLVIEGEDTSRTFWIIAHLDVVPSGDEALWQSNPFELKVEGDLLYGRGVEDNHQGLVSAVLLAKALMKEKAKPPINLGLLFVADEETGNAYGLGYLTQHHADLFKPQDLFLVPDSGDPTSTQLEIAEKGILWLKVALTGKQCHGSLPNEGINSLKAAAAFIVEAQALQQQFPDANPLFYPPVTTIEPTKIEANVPNVNTISGRDVFYFDCRVLPHVTLEAVMDAIKVIGDKIAASHHVAIDYEIVQKTMPAPATPEDSDIVTRLRRAIRCEYNVDAKPMGIGGGTVAAFLRKLGHPVVVWSTILHNPHQPNERADINYALRDAKVMARVLWG